MKQTVWVAEQRVVNEAEPELGLGRVTSIIDHRTVEIEFPAAGLARRYNVLTAPLRRLELALGQEAVSRNGTHFKIARIEKQNGLLVYAGAGQQLHERDLADTMASANPLDRLLTTQLSQFRDYELRLDGWELRQSLLSSHTRGLGGARVRLLPHQLYIAHKISRQEIPRVLLADEVGLGKTIEAGLIFASLRALGRADRVLILTPVSLKHQWLAEMYRRFNEMFSVLDEARCADMESGSENLTPFQLVQRVICSIDLLDDPRRLDQAVAASWDLVIVDEAHHLRWSETEESPAYQAVRRVSENSTGLLLLTATPLRQGYATEFGLLKLVDPQRFPDLTLFTEEMSRMQQVARLAQQISTNGAQPEAVQALRRLYPADAGLQRLLDAVDAGQPAAVDSLMAALTDRHGTGRVLIRNRRDRLHAFPDRVLHPQAVEDEAGKVKWLIDFLHATREEKTVLICSEPATVLSLGRKLKRHGVQPALFHENLSIIERDRQAAWFSEDEGAQVLLCSEIGGEGRNFQFSHQLVLFDLPGHPDTLEQRIGRLDRIGQEHEVHIYALYVSGAPSEALFLWHHQGLNDFLKPVNAGERIIELLQDDVDATLSAWEPKSKTSANRQERLDALLERTRDVAEKVRQEIQDSLDYLIDLNSFDETVGHRVVQEIQDIDEDPRLQEYLSRVLERFGVVEEDLDDRGRKKIMPGDLMFVEFFPGLARDEAIGATYRQDTALIREELDFLSRDHPLVQGAMALLLDENEGNATACGWPGALEPGLVFQFLFVFEAAGPPALELSRYLPPTPIEIAIDHKGKIRDHLLETLKTREIPLRRIGSDVLKTLMPVVQELGPELSAKAQDAAGALSNEARRLALAEATTLLKAEHERLLSLKAVNPTLPDDEIARHADEMRAIFKALKGAAVRLDAVRLIVMED